MRMQFVLIVAAALSSGVASAQSEQPKEQQETLKAKVVEGPASGATVCKQGNSTRRIEIVSTAPGKKVPCEVHYKKDGAEGGDKVLYKADKQEGYCEEKAKAFADKLSGMGWTCAAQ
jgi:hypothetical protein